MHGYAKDMPKPRYPEPGNVILLEDSISVDRGKGRFGRWVGPERVGWSLNPLARVFIREDRKRRGKAEEDRGQNWSAVYQPKT